MPKFQESERDFMNNSPFNANKYDFGSTKSKNKRNWKKKKDDKKEWEPAFPGADHSQEELDKMTKEQQADYYG